MPDSKQVKRKEVSRSAIYREAVRVGLKSSHFWHLFVLGVLLIYGTLFYYFGELGDLFRWRTLNLDFFYGAHDIQRVLFLAPIVYAGYVFGRRAAIIITLFAALAIFPHIMVASNDTDLIWRIIIFIVIAGVIGYITARVRRSRFLAQNRGSGSPQHS